MGRVSVHVLLNGPGEEIGLDGQVGSTSQF